MNLKLKPGRPIFRNATANYPSKKRTSENYLPSSSETDDDNEDEEMDFEDYIFTKKRKVASDSENCFLCDENDRIEY